MRSSIRVRRLMPADLAFADAVRALAGWNQTLEDWERFLTTEPQGCFLAEWNGEPAGTATTTVYGVALAWIGMVLVHPDYRRRGIGRALLHNCVDYLLGRGIQCIKLDATPLGKTVYNGLGFQPEWTINRWFGRITLTRSTGFSHRIDAWPNTDNSSVAAIDAAAFGISRARLLEAIAEQSQAALVAKSPSGDLSAFGLLRPGSKSLYLGPVVATSAQAGLGMLEELVARSEGQPIVWDIPDDNPVAVSWAEGCGFVRQRPLTRMFLGANTAPGNPRQQFALSGPETG